MRSAGIASMYQFESPLDFKLCGVRIDQEDLPWWAVQVLGWLGCVRAMQDSGDRNWRMAIRHTLDKCSPHKVYALYEQFVAAMEQKG